MIKKYSILLGLLFSIPLINAHAVNMKAQNTGKLIKGISKATLSLAIGVQCYRYISNQRQNAREYGYKKNVNSEEALTIGALNIPNLYFFISGCQDIHEAIKHWKK